MIKSLIKNFNGSSMAGLLRLLLILLPLAFAGNIIYTITASESGFLGELSEFRTGYLLLAVILSLMPWLAQSVRLMSWSRVFANPVNFSRAFQAVLATDIAAAATPTMLGGGYAKAGFLISYGFTAGEAAIITFLGSVIDAIFFGIALPAAIISCRAWENVYVVNAWRGLISRWPVVLAVIAILLAALFILRKVTNESGANQQTDSSDKRPDTGEKIKSALKKFRNDLSISIIFAARRGKLAFLCALAAAGIGWCSRYGAISALVLGLGFSADPVLFFLLQWVVFTTMTMIPTPGAIGGAEVSFALIYNGLIPSFAIPVVTTGWRFITFYMPVVLGALIFSALRGAKLRREKVKAMMTYNKIPDPVLKNDNSGKQKSLR